METMENLKKSNSSKRTWFLLSLYLIIPLAIISIAIFHGYRLEALFQKNLDQPVSGITDEGMTAINNLHFFSWLTLLFLLLLILVSIPEVQRRLKIRDLLFRRLDQAEADKEARIKELEGLNNFIRDLYDQAPIGYHSTDPSGIIIEMNETQLDWLGYSREEVIGKVKYGDTMVQELKTELDPAAFMANYIKEGFVRNVEAILRTKSGKTFPVLVNSRAVYDEQGNYAYSRTTVFDFTERKKLEELIEKKQSDADRLGLLKTQFIANVSHEIRTPLNAILGFANLLDRSQLNKNQKEFVKSIKTSGENLLTIINDILDFSKIESGALRLESIPFNLPALVHSVEHMFAYRAAEKQLDFEVVCEQGIPENLLGDPTRLTQVLINLLSNAFKFTKQGKITLKVTAAPPVNGKVMVKFMVQDTGIGIPPHQMDLIFERFGQAASDTTRLYGGTGLGLTISKQLIELQNGHISFESEEGVGTTFFLEIPYLISDKVTAASGSDKEADAHDLSKEISILIVEDNLMNQRITELLIDDWGFQHEQAENGMVALELLRKKVFDIVLLDIQMPVMDGYTTAEKIRQELGLKIPIIATTAHAFAGEREKCISYGMNDYISKPIREKELLALIKRYIPERKLYPPVPQQATPEKQEIPGFDYNYVLEVSRGKPERLREMADLFLRQSAKEMEQLTEAVNENSFGRLATVAHSMKSTVSYMGFGEGLGKKLKELEYLASGSTIDTQRIKQLFAEIQQQTADAREWIKKKFLSN